MRLLVVLMCGEWDVLDNFIVQATESSFVNSN